jgi:hypothetical protein
MLSDRFFIGLLFSKSFKCGLMGFFPTCERMLRLFILLSNRHKKNTGSIKTTYIVIVEYSNVGII